MEEPKLLVVILKGLRTHKSLRVGSRYYLERWTKEGDSPVGEIDMQVVGIQSTTGHVESGGNMRGPSRKAKYDLVTDRV